MFDIDQREALDRGGRCRRRTRRLSFVAGRAIPTEAELVAIMYVVELGTYRWPGILGSRHYPPSASIPGCVLTISDWARSAIRQSRAAGRHAQVAGRGLQCRQTSPAIHAGAYFSARCGRRGHPWRLASRKLYALVSEPFLTGAHGIWVKALQSARPFLNSTRQVDRGTSSQ